jgi:hypothetical protein
MERTTIDLTAGMCSLVRQHAGLLQNAGLLQTQSTGDDLFHLLPEELIFCRSIPTVAHLELIN